MNLRAFKQIDVFTNTPYYGNPLAVVLDGSGLTDEQMQRFAQWTNLSETTFVLPPTETGHQGGADYRVRIFTPGGELAFAGHPTLGSCHAWLEAGGTPRASHAAGSTSQGMRIVQECTAGLVAIRRDGARLAFAAPPLKRSAPSPLVLTQVAAALGLQAQHIVSAQMLDNGTAWLGLLLDSAQTVLQLAPDHLALKSLGLKVGVAHVEYEQLAPVLIARSNREARAFTRAPANESSPAEREPSVEVRAFAMAVGVPEDPVTGSLNASLAQWLIADGHAPPRYMARQGTCLGREGRVFIERDTSSQVWVGGDSITCINGSVAL